MLSIAIKVDRKNRINFIRQEESTIKTAVNYGMIKPSEIC